MKISKTLFILAAVFSQQAFAQAPKTTQPNPGFYHFSVGSFEVTTLSDGSIPIPAAKNLTGSSEKHITAVLKKNFLPDTVETSINTFLVNTGSKLILIDTGAGKIFGPSAGHLLESLAAAGYKPEQIDAVVITHAHPDHIGGLTHDGKMTFPNATLYIDKKDVDFIMDPHGAERAPKEFKAFYEYGVANISPYQKAGKLSMLTRDGEITSGVSSRASYGHTPGHNTYVVESAGEKLVLLGDLIHVASVQFPEPAIGMLFDGNPKAARESRIATLQEAAKSGSWIGAAHIAFPGVGHVRKEKTGFSFVPMNYRH